MLPAPPIASARRGRASAGSLALLACGTNLQHHWRQCWQQPAAVDELRLHGGDPRRRRPEQTGELCARQEGMACHESEELVELSGVRADALMTFPTGRARLFWPGQDPSA